MSNSFDPASDQTMDASPPSSSNNNNSAGFPMAIIVAIGFLVTSLVLAGYYIFVVKCWLNGRQSSPRRQSRRDLAERMSVIFFNDYDDEAAGLDQSVINAIPVVKFATVRKTKHKKSWSCQECAVCLSEFQPDESVKLLPGCNHAFHIDCIDTWLQSNVSCPMCRTVVSSSSNPFQSHGYDSSARLAALSRELNIGDLTSHQVRRGLSNGGNSCRFPKEMRSVAREPIRRSFSMDCVVSDHKLRYFSVKETSSSQEELGSEAGPSSTSHGVGSRSASLRTGGSGEASGRFRRLFSSFGLGRSSRSAVLPIHLDP